MKHVAKTKIYVSADNSGKRQFTVYSNQVDTPKENAMILPVPHPESIELVNLSDYPNLLGDCAACFRDISRTYASTRSLVAASCSLSLTKPKLTVLDVGSYRASIVPSLGDFDRLNTDIFTISPELETMLGKNYSEGFGFIVCQLRSGNHAYHPFAYTHALADNGKIFVPTRHFHPHREYKPLRYDQLAMLSFEAQQAFQNRLARAHDADWDHEIYSPMTDLDSLHQDGYEFVNTKSVKWNMIPSDYRWASGQPMRRWTKHGDWKNEDLWATNQYSPPTPILPPPEKTLLGQPESWWNWIDQKLNVS